MKSWKNAVNRRVSIRLSVLHAVHGMGERTEARIEANGCESFSWIIDIGGVGTVSVVEGLQCTGEGEPECAFMHVSIGKTKADALFALFDLPKLPKTTNGNVLPRMNWSRVSGLCTSGCCLGKATYLAETTEDHKETTEEKNRKQCPQHHCQKHPSIP